jgi:type IV pilus assembly protein PilA
MKRIGSRTQARSEGGFSLIELLVVILILGILAAVAIPLFLGQKDKATDASAKEVARTGAQAAETYATDHGGEYAGIEPSVLREYEHALQIAPSGDSAYLSVAEPKSSGKGYVVTAKSANGDSFTYTKKEDGSVVRSCSVPGGGGANGCTAGSW